MADDKSMQAGPLMVRHLIDGRDVLLPADAVLHLPLKTAPCFHCGKADAPYDTWGGWMCSDCLCQCVG